MSTLIHPTAVVEEGAEIGEGTEVGPHAVICRWARIGPRCRIHAGAVIGDAPQDLAFAGGESFVRIGAGCVIREHVTIHRGTKPGTETVVGDGCMLMANSHLGHNVTLGVQVIVVNGALLGGYVEVGDRAFISGSVLVHQFTRIGRLAMIGGAAGLSKDVPPFFTATPMRRNRIGGTNVVGMRRAGLTPADRVAVRDALRLLYFENLAHRAAAERIVAQYPQGPAREIADFVLASRRGICRYGNRGDEDDDD